MTNESTITRPAARLRAPVASVAPLLLSMLAVCTVAHAEPRPAARAPIQADNALPSNRRTVPNIRDVLSCPPPSAPAPSTSTARVSLPDGLQRHGIDLRRFPRARCNDGSPAALSFRPFSGDENRNRWVVSLRGGGQCTDGGSCAARWCSCSQWGNCPYATELTGFERRNMLADGPPVKPAAGILNRHPPSLNPLANYNHVELEYCSSDVWLGRREAAPLASVQPKTGAPAEFSIHFEGAEILAGAIAILRQEPDTARLVYQGTTGGALPDLDGAEEVVLAGDSAGGVGVIFHADELAAHLRQHHDASLAREPGNAPPRQGLPEVVALIDSSVGPAIERLIPGPPSSAPYGAYLASIAGSPSLIDALRDASCESVAGHEAAEQHRARCADVMHVLRHHVTTPFFVRQSLSDRLISAQYDEADLVEPGTSEPVTPEVFARVLGTELAAFGQLSRGAEEGSRFSVEPGVFAPACTKHDTIHEDAQVYDVTVDSQTLLDVFNRWKTRGPGRYVVVDTSAKPDCEDGGAPAARTGASRGKGRRSK